MIFSPQMILKLKRKKSRKQSDQIKSLFGISFLVVLLLLRIRANKVNFIVRSIRSDWWHLASFLGEPDVECLDIVCFAGLPSLFELLILFIQGLQLVLHCGRAEVTVEFAHSQDVVPTRAWFGIAQFISVSVSLETKEKVRGCFLLHRSLKGYISLYLQSNWIFP